MLKKISNIQHIVNETNEQLVSMVSSLRKEQEYFEKIEGKNSKTVTAKKKQLNRMALIMENHDLIFTEVSKLTGVEFLLISCAERLGVPLDKFLLACDGLIDQTIITTLKQLKEPKKSIPEPGTDHGPAHVIICQKPRFTITKLKEMAKSQKGTIPTIKDLIQ